MKLIRTTLGAALLTSAFAGGAYAGNYGGSDSTQQRPQPSAATPAPTDQSSTMPSGTAPSNSASERDLRALDTNHDGVISADERRQAKPGMRGGQTGTSNSAGTDTSGTQPQQGSGSDADRAPANTGNPTPGSLSRPPPER